MRTNGKTIRGQLLEEWAAELRDRARLGDAESMALLGAAAQALAARDAAVQSEVRVVRGFGDNAAGDVP